MRAVLSENVPDSCQILLFMFIRPLQILCHGLYSREVLPCVCWALKHEAVLRADTKTDYELKLSLIKKDCYVVQ